MPLPYETTRERPSDPGLIVVKTDELFDLEVDRLCLDLGRRVHHTRITASDGTPVLVSAMPCEPLESALPEKDLAIIKRYRRHVIAPGLEPAGYDEDGPDGFHVSPNATDRFTVSLAPKLDDFITTGVE